MGLKEKLSKQAGRRTVELEVDGAKESVEIRELTFAQKTAAFEMAGGAAEGTTRPRNMARFTAALVVMSTFEPGTTKRIWSDDELDVVLGAGPHIDPLEQACLELLGEGNNAPKESEPTGSTESGSSLPSDSAGPSTT